MWDNFEENWDEDENQGDEHSDSSPPPLLKKANNIVRLTFALVGSLDEPRRALYGNLMLSDAKVIPYLFQEAEANTDYLFKMEHAVLIKVHARKLHAMSYQLAGEGTHAEEHLQLLRDAIKELKFLFVAWVNDFDSSQRKDDGWGLFLS